MIKDLNLLSPGQINQVYTSSSLSTDDKRSIIQKHLGDQAEIEDDYLVCLLTIPNQFLQFFKIDANNNFENLFDLNLAFASKKEISCAEFTKFKDSGYKVKVIMRENSLFEEMNKKNSEHFLNFFP